VFCAVRAVYKFDFMFVTQETSGKKVMQIQELVILTGFVYFSPIICASVKVF